MAKLEFPQDALAFWLSLGRARSHGAVAQRFGVSPQTVRALAKKDDWECRALEADVASMTPTREEVDRIYVRTLSILFEKALESLSQVPLEDALRLAREFSSRRSRRHKRTRGSRK